MLGRMTKAASVAAVLAVVTGGTASASAGEAGTTTEMIHEHEVVGSDGSRITLHLREHVSTNGNGEVKVSVETKTLHTACE